MCYVHCLCSFRKLGRRSSSFMMSHVCLNHQCPMSIDVGSMFPWFLMSLKHVLYFLETTNFTTHTSPSCHVAWFKVKSSFNPSGFHGFPDPLEAAKGFKPSQKVKSSKSDKNSPNGAGLEDRLFYESGWGKPTHPFFSRWGTLRGMSVSLTLKMGSFLACSILLKGHILSTSL